MNDIAERLVKKQTKNETDLDYLMYQLEKVELFKNIFQYSTMKMSKDFLESLETVQIPKSSVIFTESSPIDDYSYLVLKGQIIILTKQSERLNRKKYFDSLMTQFRISNPGKNNIVQNNYTSNNDILQNSPLKSPQLQKNLQTHLASPHKQNEISSNNSISSLQLNNQNFGLNNNESNSISQNLGQALNLVSNSHPNEKIELFQSSQSILSERQVSEQQSPILTSAPIISNFNSSNYQGILPPMLEEVKKEILNTQEQYGKFYGYVSEGNLFGEESIYNPAIMRKKFYSYTAIAGSDSIIALVNTSLVNHILNKIDQKFNGRIQQLQNLIGIQSSQISKQKPNCNSNKKNSYLQSQNQLNQESKQQTLVSLRISSPQRYKKQQFEEIDHGYQRQDVLLQKILENNKKRKKNSNTPLQNQNKCEEQLWSPKYSNNCKSDNNTITQTKVIITNVLRSKCQFDSSMQSILSQQYQNDKVVQQIQYQSRINRSQSPPCSRQESKRRLQKLLFQNTQPIFNSSQSKLVALKNQQNNQFERKNRSHSPLLSPQRLQQIPTQINSPSPVYQTFYQQRQDTKLSPQDKIDFVKKIYVSKNQSQIIKDKKSIKQLYQKEIQQDKSISYSNFLQNNQISRSLEKSNIGCLVISASSIKQKI